MNTYEKCQAIRRIIVNRAAEVMAYPNWSNEFAAKEIREIPKSIKKMKDGKSLFNIQPSDLTDAQMTELGFGRRCKNSPIRLIPLYLFHFLADEIDIECINGKKQTMKKSKMDSDHRFGCLAYGIVPKKG